MTTYTINPRFSRADADIVANRLRKDGFSAWTETQDGKPVLVTDAGRSTVLLAAGHGQFLSVG